MCTVTYLIEYLGEIDFIFETILDYESVDQIDSFDAKNRHRKSHAWAPLRGDSEAPLVSRDKVKSLRESRTSPEGQQERQ
jgi:hypothetical protein